MKKNKKTDWKLLIGSWLGIITMGSLFLVFMVSLIYTIVNFKNIENNHHIFNVDTRAWLAKIGLSMQSFTIIMIVIWALIAIFFLINLWFSFKVLIGKAKNGTGTGIWFLLLGGIALGFSIYSLTTLTLSTLSVNVIVAIVLIGFSIAAGCLLILGHYRARTK